MAVKELRKLIDTGEKIDVEFKKSEKDLNKTERKSFISEFQEVLGSGG